MTNFSKRFERPVEFLQQRLSSESTPGLHLDCCWFGVIAEDLSPNGPLALVDHWLCGDLTMAEWF
jgi:hypothetical protein